MIDVPGLKLRFKQRYGKVPRVFCAPGRVNLIGEHTDYNSGLVMPAAIEFHTFVAAAPGIEARLRAYSENLDEAVEFDLADSHPKPARHWGDYLRGVEHALRENGVGTAGADLSIRGDVPMGAGLSSSAALEVSVAMALTSLAGATLGPMQVARLCQRAENEFAGARCGIMDQFTSCFGRQNCAVLLDCRSLDYRYLSLPPGLSLVIANTLVKHSHAAGEYNLRRQQCEEGVRVLKRCLPAIRTLRDVELHQLVRHRDQLGDVIYRRCLHVVEENARVEAAADALAGNRLDDLGRLMNSSHRSLRNNYEVCTPELDALVEIASPCDGVYGSRMTGGGFGGCTISLIESEQAESVAQRLRPKSECEVYICSAVNGARELE